MPFALTPAQTRWLRLHTQHLFQNGARPPVGQLLREVAGVQAQDWPAALQGVGVRGAHLTASEVEEALASHAVARTWCLRGTLHLIDAQDAAWMVPLLGALFLPGGLRRLAQLGFDEARADQGVEAIQEAMIEQGLLTKAQVAQVLEAHGLPSAGQAPVHVLYRGAMQGIFSLGPVQKGKPTYGLFASLVGALQPLPHDEALARLARRYLQAFGPAAPEDLAAWSGLPLRQARAAWELVADERVEVQIAGQPGGVLRGSLAWLDDPPPAPPVVNLLPAFDNYFLAYARRDLAVEPRFARRVNAGGGIVHPVVLVGGIARGTWKLARKQGGIDVVVDPFEPLPPDSQPGLEREIARLKRYLGRE